MFKSVENKKIKNKNKKNKKYFANTKNCYKFAIPNRKKWCWSGSSVG